MIDRNTIDRIFAAADIVEVIGEFVNLKKSGQNYRGLSPFKTEKTPSFFVSPSKGIFKCFSSGIGGNVVSFLMEHEKISYPEALRYLAKKYNIEILEKEESAEEIQRKNERESLLAVNQFACQYFTENLNRDEGRAIAKSYLIERGFHEDVLEKFQIGYARDDRTSFLKTAVFKGYKTEYLVGTGLVVQHETYSFDRFHGRIMFPIHSLSGQIVGFGGRVIKSNEKVAKYINSPESEIFHKSDILYGLYFARQSVLKSDKCFLVEGYTDVISMSQCGVENVVASSGTSLTLNQIRLIKRFTHNITVLYDGDEAGIKASLRGIDILLEEGLSVRVVLLPQGEDPDSFARKNSSSDFIRYITENETDFVTFKVNLLAREAEKDPLKKASMINEVIRSISVIPESIVRSVYIRECSRIFDIDERLLYSETAKIRKNLYSKKTGEQYVSAIPSAARAVQYQNLPGPDEKYHAEKEIIRLLLLYGNHSFTLRDKQDQPYDISVKDYLIHEISRDELDFHHPVMSQIYAEIMDMTSGDHLEPAASDLEQHFITHPDEIIGKTIVDLITSAHDLSKIWRKFESYFETEEMRLSEIVPEALLSFKHEKVLRLIQEAEHELLHAQQQTDEERIHSVQSRFMILNDLKKSLSKDLGDRIIVSPPRQ